jgi:hypothetical protein
LSGTFNLQTLDVVIFLLSLYSLESCMDHVLPLSHGLWSATYSMQATSKAHHIQAAIAASRSPGASVQSAVRSKPALDRRHEPERHATEDRMRSGVLSVWICDHEGRQVRQERYCHTYKPDRNRVSVLGGQGAVTKSAQPFSSVNLVKVATRLPR